MTISKLEIQIKDMVFIGMTSQAKGPGRLQLREVNMEGTHFTQVRQLLMQSLIAVLLLFTFLLLSLEHLPEIGRKQLEMLFVLLNYAMDQEGATTMLIL